jgi:ubiquinone/menaquinone biosynthesis C-methylase UbiE
MDASLQRRIQRYGWDKAADRYEDGWRESLALAQAELLRLADPKPGEQVLDIACGTGLVTFPLAERVGPGGRVIGSDISERMVCTLRESAAAKGYANIEAVRADAEVHGMIADASMDLVTCALGLMDFPGTLEAMHEIRRVLRPGGRAVFAVWGARRNCGWAEIFPIVDARVKSEVCPLFFRLGTGSALAREAEQAGLSVTAERRISTTLPYPDEAAALSAAFAGGPVALAYNRFDAEAREAAHAEYLASIAPYRDKGGYRIPGEFVICAAVRAD